MTEVYINRQRVYFKENTTLKLTIENTFFEDAGSYTLDVAFPLNIPQNRKVFGAVNRLDVSKRYQTFDALVVTDSKVVFKGTAKTTAVNAGEVKLQLLSGNSSVKFWTKAQKMYIDELPYQYTDNRASFDGFVAIDAATHASVITAGSFPGRKGQFCYVPILDESGTLEQGPGANGLMNEHQLMVDNNELAVITHGGDPAYLPYYIDVYRECICPNLMFVFTCIANHLGYTVGRNDRDNAFVNAIYIATARRTTVASNWTNTKSSSEEMAMAKALPHWTVEEFVKQMQQFLNVTVIFDDIRGTVDIVSDAYTDGTVDITASTEDEYEVEVIDDEDVAANLYDSNVAYKEGASEYHAIDMVEREIIKSFTEVTCTREEAQRQWDAMPDDEKKITVWTTEQGQFCAKVSTEENAETLEMVRFNHFGAIVRNTGNDNDIELKISPVATTADFDMYVFDYQATGGRIYRNAFGHKAGCKHTALCLQNQCEAANKPTVWDAINGTQQEESEKEDIMQVFLMDDKAVASGFYHLTIQAPFTHHDYNTPNPSVHHEEWSLSLANDSSSRSIGLLHQSARRQNRNAEHRVTFTAARIPSVYSIFIIRNKRYACKKLEVRFTAEGMERRISGYFEEIQ